VVPRAWCLAAWISVADSGAGIGGYQQVGLPPGSAAHKPWLGGQPDLVSESGEQVLPAPSPPLGFGANADVRPRARRFAAFLILDELRRVDLLWQGRRASEPDAGVGANRRHLATVAAIGPV
jgi:hypothetical protein